MKCWLILFDIVMFVLVMGLLCELKLLFVWLIIYGWCFLVLKEIVGSGYLDLIVVSFMIFVVLVLVCFY